MQKKHNLSYSVIIFTRDEPKTIKRAVQAVLSQIHFNEAECLIVAPDIETKRIIMEVADGLTHSQSPRQPIVRYLQDKGVGKPAALNMAMSQAKGEVCVLTDGDVYIGKGAIKLLLAAFSNPKVGAVSGHPIPSNTRETKYGFWAHLLTEAGAHRIRSEQAQRGEIIECSGYLMALRRKLFKPIPEDALSDDLVISHQIWQQKYEIAYVPNARVFVKYPDNFSDWKKQKIRSMAGYHQGYLGKERMRSGLQESTRIGWAFGYANSLREYWWTTQLVVARVYVWLVAMWNVKILNKEFAKIWERVESTK